MTDPLDALCEPTRPVDPDPAFAADLRARLERAVLDPIISLEDDMLAIPTRSPGRAEALPLATVVPYLTVLDARAAVELYAAAFGAAPRGEPIVMPDGRIGHAEIAIGESVVMLADEYPELGLVAPRTRGGATQSLHLQVADPDAAVARAVALGATLERPVADESYGRSGVVRDPSGHRWMITRQAARPGDVVFASLWTPDAAVAGRFYAAALGFTPHVDGGHERPELMLCYNVANVDAAVARVRAAGGTVTSEPEDRPYGRVADFVDDQGIPFALHEGQAAPADRPASVELRVPDATRVRAFYGTVLGWGFEPDSGPDRWHALRTDGTYPRPAARITGGAPAATVVPWFTVGDLDAATAAVRAAGGQVAPAPGGVVECSDDQGAAFVLAPRRVGDTGIEPVTSPV